jgi:hypothetical protein
MPYQYKRKGRHEKARPTSSSLIDPSKRGNSIAVGVIVFDRGNTNEYCFVGGELLRGYGRGLCAMKKGGTRDRYTVRVLAESSNQFVGKKKAEQRPEGVL